MIRAFGAHCQGRTRAVQQIVCTLTIEQGSDQDASLRT